MKEGDTFIYVLNQFMSAVRYEIGCWLVSKKARRGGDKTFLLGCERKIIFLFSNWSEYQRQGHRTVQLNVQNQFIITRELKLVQVIYILNQLKFVLQQANCVSPVADHSNAAPIPLSFSQPYPPHTSSRVPLRSSQPSLHKTSTFIIPLSSQSL